MVNALKEKSGVVYTKSWVVELILDLAGYCAKMDLCSKIAVEPSAGDGAFLLPMVERLVESARLHGKNISDCTGALITWELDEISAEAARRSVINLLAAKSVPAKIATALAESWVISGDFLLHENEVSKVDFVIGNPPYIRLEDIEPSAAAEYRKKFKTMVGRADIYIAFFEASLKRLTSGGVCAFICADRWMRNQYGAGLRKFITSGYSIDTIVEMHNADAFESDVSAYPAITIIRKEKQGAVAVATMEPEAAKIGADRLCEALSLVRDGAAIRSNISGLEAARIETWFNNQDPWACGSPEKLALLKRLEAEFFPLESGFTQTTVGIGIATGADKIYITTDPKLVEESRLLPMAMAYDSQDGKFAWSGHYLVNPWDENGLIDLANFPRLEAYFKKNLAELQGRHIAQKSARNWYRTIDRVNHDLTKKTKLYIADIKDRLAPVLDEGNTYPHHNLYFVQSDGWDMEVLGGLLLSSVSQLFVECYGVRMRGGYLRFQAQYLRKIRVPMPQNIRPKQAEELRLAFRERDIKRASLVAFDVYRIDEKVGKLLGY